MQIKCYVDLYTGDKLKKKKNKTIQKLMQGECSHSLFIITLAQGEKNQLEFYASSLLKQHIYDDSTVFVVGLAQGYSEAVYLVQDIVQDVLDKTGTAEVRNYIEEQQKLFEEGRL